MKAPCLSLDGRSLANLFDDIFVRLVPWPHLCVELDGGPVGPGGRRRGALSRAALHILLFLLN